MIELDSTCSQKKKDSKTSFGYDFLFLVRFENAYINHFIGNTLDIPYFLFDHVMGH
jgi:hypothetical protein